MKENHALYPPSGASWWMNCEGCASLLHKCAKEDPSPDAELGTKAHKWIDDISKSPMRPKILLRSLEKEDAEMFGYVKEYITFLEDLSERFLRNGTLYQKSHEHKVHFHKMNWGTLDFTLIRKADGYYEVIICDFKYGKGVPVTAKENKQLINYLIAKNKELNDKIKTAWLYIYQPRNCGEKPYTVWKVTKEEIAEWTKKFTSRLKVLEEVRAGDKEAVFSAGSWCQFCPVNRSAICPQQNYLLRQEARSQIDQLKPIIPDLKELTLDQKINIRKHSGIFKAFLNAVAADLQRRLEAGLKDPRIKLVPARTNRKWRSNTGKIAQVLESLGVDPWEKSLIGITNAEKAVGKKVVEKMTFKPEGRLQVVLSDDTRDAFEVDGLDELSASAVDDL